MMIPLVIDNHFHTFMRESNDPSKGFNYCCEEMKELLTGDCSPIELSYHTHKLILLSVGESNSKKVRRFRTISLNFCPCCGEEITYDS